MDIYAYEKTISMAIHAYIVLGVFIVTYIGLIAGRFWGLRLDRTGVVLLGAIAMLAIGGVSLQDALNSINFEFVLLIFALMVICSQLQHGGFYDKVASLISRFLDKPALSLFVLMLTSGILSAFSNNNVICLVFTPFVIRALVKKNLNPIPFLIALIFSCNIGCSLTLIGNAQNILIGQLGHLNFGKYILWSVVPVFSSMFIAYWIILLIGRKDFILKSEKMFCVVNGEQLPFKLWRTIKGLIAVTTIIILFFTDLPRYLVALVAAGILLCSHKLESKDVLKLVDWQILILFLGLFVVVGAFKESSCGPSSVLWLNNHGVDLGRPLTLAVITGVSSSLINNAASAILLVNFVDLTKPEICYVLALANSFAGNFLLIGSVTGLMVVQEAKNYNVNITFINFAKYGIPVAMASFAILLSWIYIMI